MCIHTINEYPFCSEENTYVTAEDATMVEGDGNQMCRKYSFSACEKFTRTGLPCLANKIEREYREAIEARKDTIIRVHFTDCNMRRNVNMGCKVGNGKRTTDYFNKPLLICGIKDFYFCGCRRTLVDADDAIFMIKGYISPRIICSSYTFYPCNLMQINGTPCVEWTEDEHEYREKLEKRDNTIILVSLEDCNLHPTRPMGCKLGRHRKETGRFSEPIVPEVPRRVKPGAEEEFEEVIWSRERNKHLLSEVSLFSASERSL
ncbi:hypothetical protein DFP73DRAFT_620937 [Morchella snyderi]|nr:hypothetical protein DFP73DRAFT_620937 [Morchella snyderi]